MKRNKIVASALVLAAILLLASCTPAGPAETAKPSATPYIPDNYEFNLPEESYDFGGRTVTLYSYHGQAFEQREDFMRRYALDAQIEQKYNVKIRYDLDMQRGANDALVGSPTIDAGLLGLHTLFTFYNGGSVEPLNPYFTELHYDGTDSIRWDAQATEWNSMGGKVYAMAPTVYELWKFHNVYALFMNKDLLSQRGIDPQEIYTLQENKQWTWDKFAEYAGRVTADINHDDVPDIYGTAINGGYLLRGLLTSEQADYIVYDNESKTFGYEINDAFTKAVTFIKSLLDSGASRLPESMSGINENVDIQDFMTSKLGFYAYIFQRTWQAGFFGEMADDYGVLCFPMAEGQTEYYLPDNCNGGWALYTHPDKEDSKEICKFLYVYKTPLFNTEDPTDEQDAYWDEGLNRIRDEESRYFLELVYDQKNVRRNNDTTFLYNGLGPIMGLDNIWNGSMTVTEALSSTLPVCKEFIANFYDKTGVTE